MKFDIQAVAPSGYEVVGYRVVKFPEPYIDQFSGDLMVWDSSEPSTYKHLILKKLRWTPEPGSAYWTICIDTDGVYWAGRSEWVDHEMGARQRDRGVVFETEAEAKVLADKLNEAVTALFEAEL